MQKKEENVQVASGTEAKGTSVALLNNYTIGDIAISQDEFDGLNFEDASGELLSRELLDSVLGIQVDAIMTNKSKLTIKGEEKDFVTLNILGADGDIRTVLAGQYKFIEVYDRFDRGNGVAVRFTFEGVKAMKNSAKTVNTFKFLAKSL